MKQTPRIGLSLEADSLEKTLVGCSLAWLVMSLRTLVASGKTFSRQVALGLSPWEVFCAVVLYQLPDHASYDQGVPKVRRLAHKRVPCHAIGPL